ncbi:uncharacterized protein KIAA0232 homolog isoform X2 [Pimephales promelas]|uniref:uncharacterized protein KIAA0232 homolog isoform X2 n=1 Tax=Pimephales promelas TaxID=90988 RepID=UPI00195593AC|nr:uncharacterized protein KIAA0232 homolog isoform X2 [Pimephales promelas]KAG1960426.1 hypothetical protein F2P79_006306 [Pimephales promelas]
MRPMSGESDGPAPERVSQAFPLSGPVSSSEMSSLQSLGPVQSWLGQELEKCGIDAMIYTRYVLSLLLHDSYDYDLQDQENDIFLGWEKGTGKKWGKSKKKGVTDLSLEEMKKQAAVQCLRSASDENSGIESLVEELCSKLKDIQNKHAEKEKQGNKKSDISQSPEPDESLSSKDQVEMYYEAFPPLSEKPVCLKEIMTVWNKAKACTYSSSSSSAVPQTSTDTSSPKDCTSEGEAFKDRTVDVPSSTTTTNERAQQRRIKREKENRFHGSATGMPDNQVAPHSKRQPRHRSEGRFRPRSWSSGSSEAGSSSSGNQGDQTPSCKTVRLRHKSREVSSRSKRGRSGSGQVKLALKVIDKEERKNSRGNVSTTGGPPKQQHYMKKSKRPLREIRKDANLVEAQESGGEANKKEYMEEPLWYTEPISEYFVPLSRSKLETKYRSTEDSSNDLAMSIDMDCLSERIQGICIANSCFQRAYLAAGTFVDGHFIEVPGEGDEEAPELNGIPSCHPPEDGQDLDDEHLSEFTHFYEVDLYQSILDPSASDAVQESRILNMIRQKSIERKHFEAGCVVLDGLELQGESAIRVDSLGASEADVSITQDMETIAQVWECCSSSSLEDLEGESCPGDSPVRLSPVLDSVPFNFSNLSGAFVGHHLQEASGSISDLNSCFSLFELQYDSPSFSFPCDSLTPGQDNVDSSSCLDPQRNKQSRLLIWTKNSAFDETEHCSNLSTRTCSPWSHSEETRSDSEQINALADESVLFGNEEVSCISLIPPLCLEEELLDFFQENSSHQQEETNIGVESNQPFNKKSKLESVCGIALEQDESKLYNAVVFSDVPNQQSDEYTSGIIKDIWMAIGDRDCVLTLGVKNTGEHFFSEEAPGYQCSCLDKDVKGEIIQKTDAQCSEYHLWDGQKEDEGLPKNKLSKINDGDYTTPAKPWNCNSQDSTSFILGGVYGELKTLSGDREWAMVPPGDACGSLLQCAAATSSDMVTIAGADVFMNTSSRFAPGHRPLWRPLVSLGQNEQTSKGPGDGLNKGFSVVFHEDLLGSCGGFRGEESGLDYPFSSFDLNNPFSQVLHVECSFEPEDMASFSPGFKPKSILCSDNEPFCPWLYGINRTQYRAIRISPRTHFRPISASELSPGGCSESDVESDEKEEASLPVSQADLFDDPQADLKPLEEDAECEGPYYGKSELESGKFLPRLKKSGMEKSAQTSLDSQEGGSTLLPISEQEICVHCETAVVSKPCSHVQSSVQQAEGSKETESCKCAANDQIPETGKSLDVAQDMHEFPLLNFGEQCLTNMQQEECWWQSTLCSPLFPGSQCGGSSNV